MKMEITEVNYNIETDDFTIFFGVFNDNDDMIMELSQNITLKDAKEIPQFPIIEKILLKVKQETLGGLN